LTRAPRAPYPARAMVRVPFLLPTLIATLLVAGCSRSLEPEGPKEKLSGESVAVEVNSRAPAFATRTLGGETVRLADHVGENVVLLEFWSIFCKSCIEEMPHIEALYERYRDEGLAVLSVNTDFFSSEKVSSFLAKAGIRPPYPVLRDLRQEIVGAYGVEVLPVTVIIDREGWIRLYQEGYRPGDEERFEARVRRLLGKAAGEDVTLGSRQGVTAFAPTGVSLAGQGERLEGLRAAGLDGKRLALDDAGLRLFFFWSLYCRPCRGEYPAVAELGRKYGKQGLRAFAVNVDSHQLRARVERFANAHPDLPCLLDDPGQDDGELAKLLGVRVTPTIVLLDEEGAVAYAAEGAAEIPSLEEKIRELISKE